MCALFHVSSFPEHKVTSTNALLYPAYSLNLINYLMQNKSKPQIFTMETLKP